MTKLWYSAKLRFVVFVENEGATRYSDSVFLLCATDYEDAFGRALMLGRSRQQSYLNPDKLRVAWRFMKVETLDELSTDALDGVEVYHEFAELPPSESLPFDATFTAEASRPLQTGV